MTIEQREAKIKGQYLERKFSKHVRQVVKSLNNYNRLLSDAYKKKLKEREKNV